MIAKATILSTPMNASNMFPTKSKNLANAPFLVVPLASGLFSDLASELGGGAVSAVNILKMLSNDLLISTKLSCI